MSEPKTVAERVEQVVPGVLHWTVHDDRIDFRSDAYAIVTEEGIVLIDPLPLTQKAMSALGRVSAICITGGFHQRSAWRYRKRSSAQVFAPKGAKGLEERPDHSYGPEAALPGGVRAVHAPGPTGPHYALLLERPRGTGVLFCADTLARTGRAGFRFVDSQYQDDPALTRKSARKLLGLRFRSLCSAHGMPAARGGREALRRAIERDARQQVRTR